MCSSSSSSSFIVRWSRRQCAIGFISLSNCPSSFELSYYFMSISPLLLLLFSFNEQYKTYEDTGSSMELNVDDVAAFCNATVRMCNNDIERKDPSVDSHGRVETTWLSHRHSSKCVNNQILTSNNFHLPKEQVMRANSRIYHRRDSMQQFFIANSLDYSSFLFCWFHLSFDIVSRGSPPSRADGKIVRHFIDETYGTECRISIV